MHNSKYWICSISFVILCIITIGLNAPRAPHGQYDVSIISGDLVVSADPIATTVVALYNGSKHTTCTSTLVAPNVVLTAAHCLSKYPNSLRVVFGVNMMSDTADVRRVLRYRVHPLFISGHSQITNRGDLALVQFEGDSPPGFGIGSLLNTEDALQNGTRLTIAGYGLSDPYDETSSGILRKGAVSLRDSRFSETEMVINQSPASADSKSNKKVQAACRGDSGGPAFVKINGTLFVVGVARSLYKDSKRRCQSYSVYSKVSFYRQWIQRTLEELSRASSASISTSMTSTQVDSSTNKSPNAGTDF
ncbi:MAG: trypsin-like serine protease [Bdellovibrionaceae bacterium]|nr:trypsin-like serine protease [Pseudobdellovibrionaceae bacterium]